MSKFSEKWRWVMVMFLVFVADFMMSAIYVSAGESVGSVGAFTHSHSEGCYETVTLSCESKHIQNVTVEQVTYHCSNCNGDTAQHTVVRTWKCPIKGVSWQKDCYTACNVCCAYNATWTQNMPGDHRYTEQQLKCGLNEGENTATVKIVANDRWTNQGVNLTVICEVLKQDLSSENIAFSWPGGTCFVTENGNYSVTATNSLGNTASSSIQISCIDKTPPVINGVVGNEATMTDKKIEVTVTVSDGESGLEDAAYSTDGGASWGSAGTFWVEEGKNIQFAVRDRAGNVSTTTISRSQFPYPPKPVTPSASITPSTPSAPATPIETVASTALPSSDVVGTTTVTAKDKSQLTAQTESTVQEKDKWTKLTREEQRQAYGISLTLQRKARDEFFMQSKVRESSKMVTVTKNDATMSPNDKLPEMADTHETAAMTTEIPTPVSLTTVYSSDNGIFAHLQRNAGSYLGVLLCVGSVGFFAYLLWLHSAVLYCYEGGEEYRKIGFFHIKRGKNELELYLPDYVLQSTKAFRYRLMLKNRLVKKCANQELVVYNEDSKLRQQVEECVDFVL